VTSVTPAEIAGPTYYPYERCTRWPEDLELASESSYRALALDYLKRTAKLRGANQVISTRTPANRSAQAACRWAAST